MSNPKDPDPAVTLLLDAENPPTTGVTQAINEVLGVIENHPLDYGSQVRVLTKALMIINDQYRLKKIS
jgi:hypothetical protein